MADFDFVPINVKAEDIERAVKIILAESSVAYYSDFGKAITDANEDMVGINADATEDTAVASVMIKGDERFITLLKDIEVSALDYITKTMTLDLNGKTLSLGAGVSIRTNAENIVLTVAGNGGKISKNINTTSANERILFAYYGTIKVLGGEYNIKIQNNTATSTGVFWCRTGATLNLNNCDIREEIKGTSGTNAGLCLVYGGGFVNVSGCVLNAKSEVGDCVAFYVNQELTLTQSKINISSTVASSQCVIVRPTATCEIVNCDINAISTGGTCIGVSNLGTSNIDGCKINTNSTASDCLGIQNIEVLSAKNTKIFADALSGDVADDAYSKGIDNDGKIELIDCEVYGLHSGLTSIGECYINGGLYEGIEHGGIYLSDVSENPSENPKEMFIENATIAAVPYRGQNKDKFKTRRGSVSALYVSWGHNLSLYLDNCLLKGGTQWVMVVAHANNKVYMSNCSLDFNENGFISATNMTTCVGLTPAELEMMNAESGDLKTLPRKVFRIDDKSNKVYFGKGNNFKVNHLLAWYLPESTGYTDTSDVFETTDQNFYIRELVE